VTISAFRTTHGAPGGLRQRNQRGRRAPISSSTHWRCRAPTSTSHDRRPSPRHPQRRHIARWSSSRETLNSWW